MLGSGNIAIRKQAWPLVLKKLRVFIRKRQIICSLINKIITTECEKCIEDLEKSGKGDLKDEMKSSPEELGEELLCRCL